MICNVLILLFFIFGKKKGLVKGLVVYALAFNCEFINSFVEVFRQKIQLDSVMRIAI